MAAPMRGKNIYAFYSKRTFYMHCIRNSGSNKFCPHFGRLYGCCKCYNVRQYTSKLQRKSILKCCERRTTASLSNSARSSTTLSTTESEKLNVNRADNRSNDVFRNKIKSGPGLGDFISASISQENKLRTTRPAFELLEESDSVPYLDADVMRGGNRNVYFETYGCQMNVNDTEIAWSILQKNGFQKVNHLDQHTVTDGRELTCTVEDHGIKKAAIAGKAYCSLCGELISYGNKGRIAISLRDADVALIVTCSIRENAEQKIWNRLEKLQHLKNRRMRNKQSDLKVGLLGCMAERLKRKIVERSKIVDVVAGPDAYRDLPRLLSQTDSAQAAINVMLSMDETYADVIPVRMNQESKSAFVSIMRGCDNMCSYCIVPFTRGRERSRPIASILEEVRSLSDQGVKEVTLLGQNVNSYRDTSESSYYGVGDVTDDNTAMARGFSTIYKNKKGGLRFSYLLEKVSEIDPEMRIRFTSPHPKDFPDEVLHVIKEKHNICNQLHLPAQSGSSEVLSRMRRGYTREAYIDLVDHVQRTLPGVSLSSDFIAGFCGETEAEHQDTLSLLKLIKYNYAFLFAYSMRQKTHAYHKMKDDVPEDVKKRRLKEIVDASRIGMAQMNVQQIGSCQLVLIEGKSKKSDADLAGRNDGNVKVIIPGDEVAVEQGSKVTRPMQPGDYVAVKVTDCTSQTLKGIPLFHTSLQQYAKEMDAAKDFGRDYQIAAEQ